MKKKDKDKQAQEYSEIKKSESFWNADSNRNENKTLPQRLLRQTFYKDAFYLWFNRLAVS